MPLSPSLACPGLLVRLKLSGMLTNFHNRYGIILNTIEGSSLVQVKILPPENEMTIVLLPENMIIANIPPKDVLKSYCEHIGAEFEKDDLTYTDLAQNMSRGFLMVHNSLRRSDRTLLLTYLDKEYPGGAAGKGILQTMLNDSGNQFCNEIEDLDSAFHESRIELARLLCLSSEFQDAFQLVTKMLYQTELTEKQKNDCLDVLHIILRNAENNEFDILGKTCVAILGLRNCDADAIQFLTNRSRENQK